MARQNSQPSVGVTGDGTLASPNGMAPMQLSTSLTTRTQPALVDKAFAATCTAVFVGLLLSAIVTTALYLG